MANRDRRNGMVSDLDGFTFAQAAKSQHRNSLGRAGDAGKVWPHLIVEKGLGQSVDDATHAPNVDGDFTFAVEIIRQGAKCHYMIQMDVSDQDISDFLLRRESQRRGCGTGINEQRIIDQKRGEIVAGKLPPRGTQNAKFHRYPPSFFFDFTAPTARQLK